MAKNDTRATTFDLADTELRAGWGAKVVTLPVHDGEDEDGDPVLVVALDAIESWEDGAEITMKDLQRLLEVIERECEARGIEVEFE